jgi:hypothetical protein
MTILRENDQYIYLYTLNNILFHLCIIIFIIISSKIINTFVDNQ